ncbi:hypothetical protein GOODEAATRI_018945 [Goodea atripinnis]|uniref:Secreted protein n=1 Tax=Goodea atripinnis TaxID=208336 RepID=A0ABV0P617_9TELE
MAIATSHSSSHLTGLCAASWWCFASKPDRGGGMVFACAFKWRRALWQASCFSGGLTSGKSVLQGPIQLSTDPLIRL